MLGESLPGKGQESGELVLNGSQEVGQFMNAETAWCDDGFNVRRVDEGAELVGACCGEVRIDTAETRPARFSVTK